MIQISHEKPFGTFSLNFWREYIRNLASLAPHSRLGMWMISFFRRIALLGHRTGMAGPLDVTVSAGIKARLYPGSNRCEKRAFAGIHIWDTKERQALIDALSNYRCRCKYERPFVFIDVGANVGLYTMFVYAAAQNLGQSTQLLAIEPDFKNRDRLIFNLMINGCNALIDSSGVAAEVGTGTLVMDQKNRGEMSVCLEGEGTPININTLQNIIVENHFHYIDAMKIDIEGYDFQVLKNFLTNAPSDFWPQLLIVETFNLEGQKIILMLKEYGYVLQCRTNINAIMIHTTELENSGLINV
ncbi:FkbM family methyltransferase [Candidatus Endowatersipora endosymbiont of Watersipora subatra]|uniref:FkbM family methyltransferase n=1 Tax=Candidatus Endowatersipora endosymbiont of Watersipora subatra TaxID=3077946 RepID=UPI00312CB475